MSLEDVQDSLDVFDGVHTGPYTHEFLSASLLPASQVCQAFGYYMQYDAWYGLTLTFMTFGTKGHTPLSDENNSQANEALCRAYLEGDGRDRKYERTMTTFNSVLGVTLAIVRLLRRA